MCCCFGESSQFAPECCVICTAASQIMYPHRYTSSELLGYLREKAADEIRDAAETTRCEIPSKWMCDIHRHLHTQWLRQTGRESPDWPTSRAGLSAERIKDILDENREHAESLKATRGVSDEELKKISDESCVVM